MATYNDDGNLAVVLLLASAANEKFVIVVACPTENQIRGHIVVERSDLAILDAFDINSLS